MAPLDTAVRFDRDWDRIRHRPDHLRRARSWQLTSTPLDDLEQLVAATGTGAPAGETLLLDLVLLARSDDLATRVVLQRLLPELARIQRRRRWQGWTDVGLGDLLATGWTVVRTYNTDRRPVRVANALVSDIEYREYRAPLRRIGHGCPSEPWQFDELVADLAPHPAVELAAIVHEARAAGLTDDELDLIRRLVSGRLAVDIARDLAVTPRTIRNRRDRIALKLREVALAA